MGEDEERRVHEPDHDNLRPKSGPDLQCRPKYSDDFNDPGAKIKILTEYMASNNSLMTACGISMKFRARMPRAYRDAKKGYNSGLKALQVGRGAQRRLTDSEMAEQALEHVAKPRRLTPLKIAL